VIVDAEIRNRNYKSVNLDMSLGEEKGVEKLFVNFGR
jgi:hypothetical protein